MIDYYWVKLPRGFVGYNFTKTCICLKLTYILTTTTAFLGGLVGFMVCVVCSGCAVFVSSCFRFVNLKKVFFVSVTVF